MKHTRRDFIKKSAIALGPASAAPVVAAVVEPKETLPDLAISTTHAAYIGRYTVECIHCSYKIEVPVNPSCIISMTENDLEWHVLKGLEGFRCPKCKNGMTA